jgi:nucleotide-binding universal stress UspA family protein
MTGSDPGRIVVGLRDTLAGYQALRYAVTQARLHHAKLLAVRAVNGNAYGGASWSASLEDMTARQLAETFAEALGGVPSDISLQVVSRQGPTGMVLVAAADRENDLLVMGGAGRHRLTGPWTGSVARYCARHAICPVVIVPPPALARTGRTGRLARAVAAGAEDLLRVPAQSNAGH